MQRKELIKHHKPRKYPKGKKKGNQGIKVPVPVECDGMKGTEWSAVPACCFSHLSSKLLQNHSPGQKPLYNYLLSQDPIQSQPKLIHNPA